MKKTTLAAAFALACALPASAFAAADLSGFSGLIDGGFAYTRVPVLKLQVDADHYNFKGSLLYTFDNPGFGIQLDAQDDIYFAIKHNEANLWSAGGSVFWRDNKGTIGLTGSYFAVDAPATPLFSGKKSIENYGFFGEYYVLKTLTLQFKGGGTTGGVGYASLYAGGGLNWYEEPWLVFHLGMNFTSYTSAHDWTNVNSSIEYLPFYSLPVSLYAGYDYANVSSSRYASTFFAGLKFHFGPGTTLADYDRTGPLQWTGNSTPGANLKF